MKTFSIFTISALCALSWPSPARLLEIGHLNITEWRVPWENTRPRDPYVQDEHRVWFLRQGAGTTWPNWIRPAESSSGTSSIPAPDPITWSSTDKGRCGLREISRAISDALTP